MLLKKKRIDPDYAFEKEEEEDLKSRIIRISKVSLGVLIGVAVAVILFSYIYGVIAKDSYTTEYPVGDLVVALPENKSEFEILPGENFTFDIDCYYMFRGKVAHIGITHHDYCQIGMFFSDNRLCDRSAYDSFTVDENVKVGTEFTVTLRYGSDVSTIRFRVGGEEPN